MSASPYVVTTRRTVHRRTCPSAKRIAFPSSWQPDVKRIYDRACGVCLGYSLPTETTYAESTDPEEAQVVSGVEADLAALLGEHGSVRPAIRGGEEARYECQCGTDLAPMQALEAYGCEPPHVLLAHRAHVATAVLASGLVVPASEVEALAEKYAGRVRVMSAPRFKTAADGRERSVWHLAEHELLALIPTTEDYEGVGTGAGEGAPGQDTGSAWVTRSADCPEAPAQARPLVKQGEAGGLTETHHNWLASWFETYLDIDRFASATDADLALLLRPTVERIVADHLAAERARYEDLVEKVRALHKPARDDRHGWCTADGRRWPCPTLVLLAEAGEE